MKAHAGPQTVEALRARPKGGQRKMVGPERSRPDEAWKTHQGRLAEGFRVQAIGRTVRHGPEGTAGHRGRTRCQIKLFGELVESLCDCFSKLDKCGAMSDRSCRRSRRRFYPLLAVHIVFKSSLPQTCC